MELVYLWVEEYKNIYRQGFNFLALGLSVNTRWQFNNM